MPTNKFQVEMFLAVLGVEQKYCLILLNYRKIIFLSVDKWAFTWRAYTVGKCMWGLLVADYSIPRTQGPRRPFYRVWAKKSGQYKQTVSCNCMSTEALENKSLRSPEQHIQNIDK